MKKILLILAVFIGFQATAQEKHTIFTPLEDMPAGGMTTTVNATELSKRIETQNKDKKRAAAGWMSYQDAINITGLSTNALYILAPDSNMYSTTGGFHWWLHMLGTSFDPTSDKFYSQANGYYNGFQIYDTDAYRVDSVEVVGIYRKNIASQNDQLIIEITHTNATNATRLRSVSDYYLNNLGLTDSTLRFGTPTYDYMNNKMSDSVNPKVTITKTLDAAAAADTINGLNQWTFALPTPLAVPAGEQVIVTARFVPGAPTPLAQPIDQSNYWAHYCREELGDGTFPSPNTGEIAAGLVAQVGHRYLETDPVNGDQFVRVGGTYYMGSTYQYPAGQSFDDPYFGLYVNCPTCNNQPDATADIPSIFNNVDVYPNPANNSLNITLADVKNADMNINVYSMTGEKLATDVIAKGANKTTIDVSNFASGIYLCEMEIEGQKFTQKITKN